MKPNLKNTKIWKKWSCFGLILISLHLIFYINYDFVSKHSTARGSKTRGYWFQECHCMKHLQIETTGQRTSSLIDLESTCSEEANYIGGGQKVVSYSLFVKSPSDKAMFTDGIEPNLKQIRALYPGWYVRLYTNMIISSNTEDMCDLTCSNDELVLCDINNIPKYGNMSKMNGRMWRFLAMGDPTVDIFISRDLDSDIYQRERDSVTEWERSNFTFHMMRDIYVHHKTPMLAGMFGVKNYGIDPDVSTALRVQFIELGFKSNANGQDQAVLRNLIYNTPLSKQMLTHDSYTCTQFKGAVPFPTRRNGHEHVGDFIRKKAKNFSRPLSKCPLSCRPKYGQDWEYC